MTMVTFNTLFRNLARSKDERLHILLTAITVAENAGNIVEDAFYKLKNVSGKVEATDLVTETDKLVENKIFNALKKEFSDHSFIGEESASDGVPVKLTDTPTWIVDPIDGTCNFVHMNPNVAVCIGYVVNKKTEVGVVYAPILKDMYVSVRGYGAFRNDKKLLIESPVQSLSQALLATEWGASRDKDRVETTGKNMVNVLLKHGIHGIRCTGSAALNMCLIASNSHDIYFECGPHCWDFSAASLIVEEAGGVNTTVTGGEFDLMARSVISASSRCLIDELAPSLTQIPYPRDDE